MTTTKPTARPWPQLMQLFPGTKVELAQLMNLTRQGLHYFQCGHHRQVPWWLCAKYAKVLGKKGTTTDGSPPPKGEELTRSWYDTFGKPHPQEMT